MTKTHKVNMSPQKIVLIKLATFVFCLGAALAALIMWAKNDAASEAAQEVRDFIGLVDPIAEVVEKPIIPTPQPVVVVSAPIAMEPLTPPAPSLIEISFQELVDNIRMWPRLLELTLETSVPILYSGNNYGQMRFVAGQTIQVESILRSAEIIGSVDGNYLSIPVGKTNLQQWFAEKYAKTHTLRIPESMPSNFDSVEGQDGAHQVSLINDMRRWCYINFGACSFTITDDALVLRWLPQEDVPINFRAEAREVARKYLQFQAERGEVDNYAPCEIYHPSTGELLGAGSFFIPLSTASGVSQAARPR